MSLHFGCCGVHSGLCGYIRVGAGGGWNGFRWEEGGVGVEEAGDVGGDLVEVFDGVSVPDVVGLAVIGAAFL